MRSRRLLLLAGTALVALIPAPAALAAAAPGALDTTFGTGGLVSLPSGAQAYAAAATSDGGLVVAGSDSGGNLFAERLNSAGTAVDTYHGPTGVAHGVAVAANGDVVLAGTSNGAMIVQELSPDLAATPVWSAAAFSGQSAVADAVAVAPDGTVVAAGDAGGQTAVAGFTSGGAVAWTAAGFGSGARNSQLNGVAVQPSGDIVVVGEQGGLQLTNGLYAQLSGSGSVLHAGLVYYPGSGYTDLTSAATQPDGAVLAGGLTDQPVDLAVRIGTGGALDSSFGTAPASGSPSVAALPSGQNVLQPDYPFGAYGIGIGGGGTVLEAGNYENSGLASDQALYAFTASGQPDTALTGGQGTASQGSATVTGPDSTYEGCGMAVDPASGDIIVAGDSVTSFPASNPCGLDPTSASDAVQGYVARLIGFGPPPSGGNPQPIGTAPSATTGAADQVGENAAELTGQVNPGGLATTYHFDYGTSTAYGPSTSAHSAGNGVSPVSVKAALTGLKPGTTYHYRLVATNADGTSYGRDGTFTTSRAPGAPRFKLRIAGVQKLYRSATVLRHGLKITVTCSAACSFTGAAVLSAKTAKRMHLGQRAITVATLKGRMTKPGRLTVALVLTRAGGQLLRKLARWSVPLTVAARPASAGSPARASATLHFKR